MLSKANTNKYTKPSKIFISKQKTNIFTNVLLKAGKLEKNPKLDYALFLAYKQIKAELCNNNVETHLENQGKRGFDKVRYNLNWDSVQKKKTNNMISIQLPDGTEYKIVKSQFFTDPIIRDVFAEKIQDWYKLKFNLKAVLKANQKENYKDWDCFVIVKRFKSKEAEEFEEIISEETEDKPTIKEVPIKDVTVKDKPFKKSFKKVTIKDDRPNEEEKPTEEKPVEENLEEKPVEEKPIQEPKKSQPRLRRDLPSSDQPRRDTSRPIMRESKQETHPKKSIPPRYNQRVRPDPHEAKEEFPELKPTN